MIPHYLLLVGSFFFVALIAAQESPTQCFFLDGGLSEGSFRCNNGTTGHSSCCAAGAVCYSNGVCAQRNGVTLDYLRVGCTDKTWSDPACLARCTSIQSNEAAGIRFCNGVTISDTTEYCCDPGGMGIGSFECCKTAANIFRIAPAATVVAQIPRDFTAPRTTTSTSSFSSATSTASSEPTSTAAPAFKSLERSGNSTTIAIAVVLPVAVLAILLASFLCWRHRKKAREARGAMLPGVARTDQFGTYIASVYTPNPDSKEYFAGRDYKGYPPQEMKTMYPPQEMHSPDGLHEIGPGR